MNEYLKLIFTKAEHSQPILKSEIETALSIMTERLRQPGEAWEAAYTRALKTDTGQALYGLYSNAVADLPRVIEMPVRKACRAEHQLNALAQQRAAAGNISFEKAYEKVLLENPALYDEYRAQRGA